MGFADYYFKKQKDFEVKIFGNPQDDLKYIVVIPCFYEFNILNTLNSTWQCCRPKFAIEVIIVINESEAADSEITTQNIKTLNEVQDWIKSHSDPALRFFVLHEQNIPEKNAGAGFARKLGMDQALYRLSREGKEDGVILSLDADATVKSDYFTEIEKHFDEYSKTNVATVYFEHPLEGSEFTKEIYHAISIYELYLRYYKFAFHFIKFPYAFYTVGSCFVVSAKAYAKQGGMNSKQAGEDFYFLHKIFPLGHSYEINTTCVYPSPRVSERVPFGTGPMVAQILKSGNPDMLTYDFRSFIELKSFFQIIDHFYKITNFELSELLYQLPLPVVKFLSEQDIFRAIEEINNNCSSLHAFRKRFFGWFNAFRILKYLNFVSDEFYQKAPLLSEVEKLAVHLKLTLPEVKNHRTYLELFRKIDRNF